MNNGIKYIHHKYNEYVTELSGCTYFFDNNGAKENKVKAVANGIDNIIFTIKEIDGNVESCIFIPNGFKCQHTKRGIVTTDFYSNGSHLTYHGNPKRKKMSGQIHIKNGTNNPLIAQSDKTEAPRSSTTDIVLFPLPICRIELANEVEKLNENSFISNYFELKANDVYFNTIKVYIARKGYLRGVASAEKNYRNIFSNIFVYDNMSIITEGKYRRRASCYPQAMALQSENYELIIIATNEVVNKSYDISSIQYFQTKDYFKSLCNRNVLINDSGFFIDQEESRNIKKGMERVYDVYLKNK
ncbi:MAG: hypothetical protein L3J41_09255 [Melioribacteraceae bacterium]|nr:hypothetical protein [Melioribacteraceae bacterium]